MRPQLDPFRGGLEVSDGGDYKRGAVRELMEESKHVFTLSPDCLAQAPFYDSRAMGALSRIYHIRVTLRNGEEIGNLANHFAANRRLAVEAGEVKLDEAVRRRYRRTFPRSLAFLVRNRLRFL